MIRTMRDLWSRRSAALRGKKRLADFPRPSGKRWVAMPNPQPGQEQRMDETEFENKCEGGITRPAADPGEDDETYEIGKRDGYERAIQEIDQLTGGDGEYRYCMGVSDERHCPDPETMKQRIADRLETQAANIARLREALIEAGDRLLLLGQCAPYGSLNNRVNMRIANDITRLLNEDAALSPNPTSP